MAISDQLREAIDKSGDTHYRIARETGLSAIAITRFATGERPYLRSDTIDRLCDYFGLELCQAKGASGKDREAPPVAGKQRSKSGQTTGKQRQKSAASAIRRAPKRTRLGSVGGRGRRGSDPPTTVLQE